MSVVLDCPHCRKAVTVVDDLVGRVMACPHCGDHFTLPRPGDSPVAVAGPSHSFVPVAGIRFTFACQRCSSILEARGGMAGQRGRCPTCGAVFTIPSVDAATGRAVGDAVVEDDGQLPTPMHAYATAGAKAPKIVRKDDGEQVILCPRCQRAMPVDANTCAACGMPFTMDGAAAIAVGGSGSNGMATAALTVGVLSLLAWMCSPILGCVAIGLGIAGLRRAEKTGGLRTGRKMAIAGIVCGALSLAIYGLYQYFF
ncbi:MAG: DUF4190 domain-containing protein [Phycisphaerae bacterium]